MIGNEITSATEAFSSSTSAHDPYPFCRAASLSLALSRAFLFRASFPFLFSISSQDTAVIWVTLGTAVALWRGGDFYQINVKSTQDLMAFPAPSHEVDKPILEGKETASLAVLNQAGLAWSRAGQEGWWTEFAWYEIWMRCESSPWPCDVCMYMRFYSSPIIAVSTLNVIFIKEHLRNKLGYHLCYSL